MTIKDNTKIDETYLLIITTILSLSWTNRNYINSMKIMVILTCEVVLIKIILTGLREIKTNLKRGGSKNDTKDNR